MADFDTAPAEELRPVLVELSFSEPWADAVLEGRPYGTRAALHDAAERVLAEQDDDEVRLAVDAHPAIGASKVSGSASPREQAAAATGDAELARRLADGQREYAEHTGHAFLVCASGLSAREIVDEIDRRMALDADADWASTRDHLRRINALRLDHYLDTGSL